MERELVEKITRLVLDRLGVKNFSTIEPLSDDEIKEWNTLHQDKIIYEKCWNSNHGDSSPLSELELNDWLKISQGNSFYGKHNLNEIEIVTKKVKFSKYN